MRLGLCMIVKNEHHVIERALRSALRFMDTWCIVDTGSTDDTKEIIEKVTAELGKPGHLYDRPWVDFGHNRSEALALAREHIDWCWMLDADDTIEGPPIDRELLKDTTPGLYVTFREGCEYKRVQLFNSKFPWKYVGVLHEYPAAEGVSSDLPTLPKETWVHGRREGARNKDPLKYLKDAQVLENHLAVTTDKARTLFYLAQSYRDANKFDDAIKWYKERVVHGGWYQETWYSMFQIARLYATKGDLIEMEYWGLKAYDFLKTRNENLYLMTRIFREKAHFFKAWQYLIWGEAIKKPSDALFLETGPYEHLFEYEKTILNYYVRPDHPGNLHQIVKYYNVHGGEQTLLNMQFYVRPVSMISHRPLGFQCDDSDFVASSTSVLPNFDGTLWLNIRHVNYRQKNNTYTPMVNGVLDASKPIVTRNFSIRVLSDFTTVSPFREMVTPAVVYPSNVRGLEDMRIYRKGNALRFLATSKEYHPAGNYCMIEGSYDPETGTLSEDHVINSPVLSGCEKNWIPFNNDLVIYRWSPFEIYRMEGTSLKLVHTQDTPQYVKRMRGSTNVVEWNDKYWCWTHTVLYTTPRKYYHQLVRIGKDYKLEGSTLPMYFFENNIEYTLGWTIVGTTAHVIVSLNDSKPEVVSLDMKPLVNSIYDLDFQIQQ